MIDEEETFLVGQEALAEVEPRALLEGYFDFRYRHRKEVMLMLSELTTRAAVDGACAALGIGPERDARQL